MDANAPQQPAPTPTNSGPTQPKKGGYGKKPWWFWVLAYVVVAAVVYFLIYILFIHKSGSSTGSLY